MQSPVDAIRRHWPEYLMEAAGVGILVTAACLAGALLEHPHSPVVQVISSLFARRLLMGIVMGLVAAGIVYSPWGKQSGAHLNPSVSLTFFRLGKVNSYDLLFYAIAQLAGAALLLAMFALGFSLPLGAVLLGVSIGKTALLTKKVDAVIRCVSGCILMIAGFYLLVTL